MMRYAPFVLVAVLSATILMASACDEDSNGASSSGSSEQGAQAASGSGGGGSGADEELTTKEGYKVITSGKEESSSGTSQSSEDDNLVREPTSPDPHDGKFTLQQAVKGLDTDGELVAEIDTDLGIIFCELLAEKAPKSVANFIGLARGKRKWWNARAGAWVSKRYYDGTTFHRVIPDFMVQGGDYLGDGSGDVGYTIEDENPDARHDEAGLLCMANEGPDTNSAQFFITDGPATHLDNAKSTYTVFGECRPEDVISRIARVPQTGSPKNRPLTPVKIERVIIKRVEGGAAKAKKTKPKTPPKFDEDKQRGASPGPSELQAEGHPER
jgi:peptidyl-prolyl cis-trans isomerase A (cyclophilin A)